MPTIEEAFEGTNILLEGAQEDFERLKLLCDDFMLKDPPYRLVFNKEMDPKKVIVYVEILRKPAREIRRTTYRIINDLRNSLDQAVYAASVALGQTRTDNTHFPFRESPAQLEYALTGPNGRTRDVPVALHDFFRSLQPYPRGNGYPGGDDALCDLNRIANPNKHICAVRIQPQITGLGVSASGALVQPFQPYWNSTKDKYVALELWKRPQDFDYKIAMPAQIVFDEDSLSGVSVTGFMKIQVPKVTDIVRRLQAETRRVAAGP